MNGDSPMFLNPSKPLIPNINTLCQQYLRILYKNVHAHELSDSRIRNVSETYGEILYSSVETLLSAISISEQDVLFDLGSGLGKLVIQVFLTSVVKEACGIEIIPELHQQSLNAAQRVQHDLPDFYAGQRKLTFLSGSFLDISLAKASILIIGSPCFSQRILYPLGEIINHTPGIHTVMSLRPIPNLKRLSFRKVLRLECSWDTCLCYIYGSYAE